MINCINSKWNQLPSDIILEILRKCEKIHTCLTINKNWLKMTQYLLYREVQLKIKQDDPLFHTLTHSHFYPGRFIFRINIVSIGMTDLQPFITLITQSPHVHEILFLNPLMDSQWKYFELGIRSNPTWHNLTKIFYPFRFDPVSYQSYLNCASILKNSLRHLTIGTRRIHDIQAFFPTITHLTLNSVIDSMIEFDQLVSYFPNLIEAGIDFHPLPSSSSSDVIIPNTQQKQQQIKKLNILYTISASDQDLRYLQSRFSSLDFLQLEFHKLPQAVINNEGIIQSFFRHLSQHIPTYKVSFITHEGKLDHLILVLKTYFAGLLSSNSTHALDIIYNKDTHHYQLPQIVLSKPTQFNQQQGIALEINSRGNYDYHVAGQVTQHILTDQSISFYFHTLRYHFNQGKKEESMQLVHILPRLTLFSNLKTLVITGAKIMPISVIMRRSAPATHLIFQNCQFALFESFNTFLKHFNQPVSVELTQCEFYRHGIGINEIPIYARYTALVHLSLDAAYLRPEATSIYLKVQQERGTRCYFLDVDNQDPKDYLNFSGQIDEAMYNRHLYLCELDVLFIRIQVMSLEKLTVCWNGYRTVYDFSI